MSIDPVPPAKSKSIDPVPPEKPKLSCTAVGLLIAGGLAALVGGAALMSAFGPAPASTPVFRPPAAPQPAVTGRVTPPPAPAAKSYTEDEVKIIRDLTRTQTLTEAALERQYGN